MTLELVSLTGSKFAGEAHEIIIPTPQGQIGVFPHHMPLVSLASPGIISVRRKPTDPDDFMENFAISGGVVEIFGDTLRVLVDEAEGSDEVNEAEAQKAQAEAKNLLANAKDQVSVDYAQSLIDRSSSRIKIAELRRRRRSH